ncbi:MAG: thermonuclease family protein [Hyphomicrobiaceae bacterium]
MGFSRKFGFSRRIWRLLAIVGAAIVVAVVRQWPFDVPDRLDGRARVIDGDSLRIGGEELRLVGIDAPEGRQTCRRDGADWACGLASRDALRDLLKQRPVACDVEGVDKYDRLLAVCHIGEKDVNAWMVQNGWAVSYGRYGRDERMASQARKGIWASEFEEPRVWRDRHLRGALAAAAS